jgi:hypothetical protein
MRYLLVITKIPIKNKMLRENTLKSKKMKARINIHKNKCKQNT